MNTKQIKLRKLRFAGRQLERALWGDAAQQDDFDRIVIEAMANKIHQIRLDRILLKCRTEQTF